MEAPEQGQPQQPAAPLCPHCRQPLINVAWLINGEAGLITIYHNELACMVTISCQLVAPAPQQSRIALPSKIVH